MVDGSLIRLRKVSKALTGADFRLELGLEIAHLNEELAAGFRNKEIAALLASDYEQPTLSRNLAALNKAGFLTKIERGAYARATHPFWKFILDLESHLHSEESQIV